MINRIPNTAKLLNSDEESLRIAMEGRLVSLWTAIPGIIQSVDFSTMSCVVQPSVQEIVIDQNQVQKPISLPLLLDVPLVFPSGGGFTITFPVVKNDEVLILFSARCIDNWWQNGGIQQSPEARMHDLSDAFAIPGPKSLPNVIPSISSSKFQARNKAGTVYFQIGSKFAMKNATTNLKAVLDNLTTDLTTFSTGLTTITLAAQASALAASLATLSTQIAALLEAS
jgi:hypothetical protein